MPLPLIFRRHAGVASALMLLCACAGQFEPARRSIDDIEMIVLAAAPDASKYVPEQLQEVQTRLGDLKADFDKKEYGEVLQAAPALMSVAQGLASAAAAKRAEAAKALGGQWTGFAAALPADMTAIQKRIDYLHEKGNAKRAAGMDLDAASGSLGAARSMWSKAQAAFAAGNIEEAVAASKILNGILEDLASTLELDLRTPA